MPLPMEMNLPAPVVIALGEIDIVLLLAEIYGRIEFVPEPNDDDEA